MKIKTYNYNDDYSQGGTSSTNVEITATLIDLESVLGEPTENYGGIDDKVQHEWVLDVEIDGEHHTITIYDWKEYHYIDRYDEIDWHIGAKGGYASANIAKAVKKEIEDKIKSLIRVI